MVDPKRAAEILYKHFENLTTEQFVENLKRACPEVFEEEQENESIDLDACQVPDNNKKADLMEQINQSN